jgi:hypothetical protein
MILPNPRGPVKVPVFRGTFQGQVFSGDDLDPVLTTFKENEKGELSGIYAMEEEEGLEEGQLSEFTWETPYVLKCRWKDRYGDGTLRMLFSAQHAMFQGFWGDSDDKTFFPWSGVKQE